MTLACLAARAQIYQTRVIEDALDAVSSCIRVALPGGA